MEVKINREIREYKESMFFGLSMRQAFFSVLAAVAAVGVFFLVKDSLGTEMTGWACMLGAAPFAFMGFYTYHGMTAEQAAFAIVRSELMIPKRLIYRSRNAYHLILAKTIAAQEKAVKNRHD